MKCLRHLLLVVAFLVSCYSTPLKAITPKTPTAHETTKYVHSVGTVNVGIDSVKTKDTATVTLKYKLVVMDCMNYDTIRLIEKGKRIKGKKQIYFTDKECTVVELHKQKNTNRFGWNTVLKWIAKMVFKA
jgi:hypothetical protein